MSFFNKKKICVTHDGSFHADDLFACATLSILHNGNVRIIRTRNMEVIKKGDYIFDVGGEYDGERFFDHHQKGDAGARLNGIPYSSFGLVWKKYGEQICKNREVAEVIDRKIIQPIDAIDNGIDFAKPLYEGIISYGPDQVFLNNYPTWKEKNKNIDLIFKKQVEKITKFLLREIEIAKSDIEGSKIIMKAYENSEDKKILIIENNFPRYLLQNTLAKLTEPIYLISPSSHNDTWKVETIQKSPETMENRKLFPESWRGLLNRDNRLKEITGIEDIIFCHKSGFLLITMSKKSAIELAQKALLA